MGLGSTQHEDHAAGRERGLLGLAAVSAAITLAVCEPPPWLDKDASFLVLSGAFFAGVALVAASVWEADGGRRAAARRLVCALLAAAFGLALASLLR